MPLLSRVKSTFKFALPIALWCFIYRGFLLGDVFVSEDTFAVYAVVKYFLSNLMVGVFAHWNPFVHWGMGHVCQVGEYNPLWVITLLLNKLGVNFYHSFIWTIVLYLMFGALGVYFLLHRLIKNSFLAYLGFLLFLFSGYSMTVFTQVTLILIVVPSIWFYFLLMDYIQTQKTSRLMWMIFLFMLIMTTYIPFYFLTTSLVILAFLLILYPKNLYQTVGQVYRGVIVSPWIAMLGGLALCAAIGVSFANWIFLRGDFVVLARATTVDYNMVKDSGIPISEIMRDHSIFATLISLLKARMLEFSRSIYTLDAIAFDNQRIFYMPILAHVLVFLGFFVKINRKMLLFACVCFVLFLIAIARLSPVYEFLFNHIHFFKLFRNIFLLIPFIILFYILWALQNFNFVWQRVETFFGKNIIFVKLVLVVIALIQPFNVMTTHAKKFDQMEPSAIIKNAVTIPLEKPAFAFVRPKTSSDVLKPNDVYRFYNWHIIAMKDADHFITSHYGYPTVWSNDLSQAYGHSVDLDQYFRHKFVLYEPTIKMQPFSRLEDFLEWYSIMPQGKLVESQDQGIRVDAFNANQLQLTASLTTDKFLVYNDSYHPSWKVFVNDVPVHLIRANYAFKGVVLPKGMSHVRFEFEPWGGNYLYMGVFLIFYCFFIWCIFLTWVKRV